MKLNSIFYFLFKRKIFTKRNLFLLFFIFLLIMLIMYKSYNVIFLEEYNELLENKHLMVRGIHQHELVIENYYKKRKHWETSYLGSILFKNGKIKELHDGHTKTYIILIWKYWDWLKRRHISGFDHSRTDPLDDCSVRNCKFTGQDSLTEIADAVVIHLQHGEIPSVERRNTHQRWVFLSDESPINTFSFMKHNKPNLTKYSNIFNWSMTYRSDSDVPVPYGRTVPLSVPKIQKLTYSHLTELIPDWTNKRRDVLAAVLMSNCGVSLRMNYLNQLKRYMDIDVHGKCSKNNKNSCPGHFKTDCGLISKYLFYLVLENSSCRQYLTEKAFFHAYSKGAIPIIMGPPIEDCDRLLPPNSYLHVDNYKSAEDLAADILTISKSERKLLMYHEWRTNFEVINEHGYFGTKSRHYCRICEALNYNDNGVKIYDQNDLRLFLDPVISCR